MEKATIMLALGGDTGNTVQKLDVTPAEVAVLRVIHGDDAVFDVQPTGNVQGRTNRQELQRLTEIYGVRQPNGQNSAPAVAALFPGAAARVFETFEELDLDESLFKPTARANAASTEQAPDSESGVIDLNSMKLDALKALAAEHKIDIGDLRKKADIIAAILAAQTEPADENEDDGGADEDGVGDMNDGNGVLG